MLQTYPSVDSRLLLFPLCSGVLGAICVLLQIVAVVTPYWALFKRERFTDSHLDGVVDPLYEEGHYGLWTLCLTVFDGQRLTQEDCSATLVHFHPSSWRIFAGILATIDVVLLLLFLVTIPLQWRHLRHGVPVLCKYKTLTLIKLMLSMVGVVCGILAAVLFGIHSYHKHYKEPKGWSFGLQVVVIILEVFLLISSSTENLMAARVDQVTPGLQYSMKTDKVKLPTSQQLKRKPSLQMTLNVMNLPDDFCKSSTPSSCKTNPIFIDSDVESPTDASMEAVKDSSIGYPQGSYPSPPSTKHPSTDPPMPEPTTPNQVGRFVVHRLFATSYDNQGFDNFGEVPRSAAR